MNFIPVEQIPKKKAPRSGEFVDYKPMGDCLKEFMRMNAKYVKVVFSHLDYATVMSAYTAFRDAAKRYGAPITPVLRGDDIYLMRTDMEERV